MKIKAQFIKMAFTILLSFVILSYSFFPSQIVNAANVTVTLYIYMYTYDSSTNGQVLSNVLVTGKEGNGASFSQTTNASGYVSITGATGIWTFTTSMPGYQTSVWATSVTSSTTLQRFLIPSAQSFSGL
jgi:hypothetical protein